MNLSDFNLYYSYSSNSWVLEIWTVDEEWIVYGCYQNQPDAEKVIQQLIEGN